MEKIANKLIDSYFALEEICDARKHAGIPFQLFFYKEEQGIEELVESVRKFLNINDGIVFNYFELFESFGFRIITAPFLKDIPSVSYFDAPNQNAFFFINSTLNQERQLFSLAFELGMIYMWEQYMTSNNDDSDFDVIKAARKFAAFFLMPKETITRTVQQLGISPAEWTYELLIRIKHRFGVSAESFLYRLQELKLINKTTFTKIKSEISDFYQKNKFKEPGDSKRTPAPNGRLFDLLQLAQSHKNSEVEEITQLLNKLKITGH
jgi:Zn-dependent peptidase ImmA (M78 family)